MSTWTAADAQAHLEEVVQRALDHQPQWVDTELGQVVVLSEEDYLRLRGVVESRAEGSHA